MDTGKWGLEFTEARQRLVESSDFRVVRSRGHNLKDGVVLTSVSDVPFEMSFKCADCGGVFWFANAAWSTGGIADWSISSESCEAASDSCPAPAGNVGNWLALLPLSR
jgi:hypothetical protein